MPKTMPIPMVLCMRCPNKIANTKVFDKKVANAAFGAWGYLGLAFVFEFF